MKIYDCFIFFNELELLKLRLEELWNCVDYFVLVEATKTFSGKSKGLYFQKNKEKFSKYIDKIVHVIIDDMPTPEKFNGDRWQIEYFQRNQIMRGLKNCKDDDIIIISDVDEIPNPKKIPKAVRLLKRKNIVENIVVFKQKFFYYYLNGFVNEDWQGPMAITFKTLKETFNSMPQKARDYRYGEPFHNFYRLRNSITNISDKFKIEHFLLKLRDQKNIHYFDYFLRIIQTLKYMDLKKKYIQIIKNGGWHFTYLGGPDRIIQKIDSFCDKQFDTPELKDIKKINEKINQGKDLFDRNPTTPDIPKKVVYIPLDKSFPKTLLKNKAEYTHLIKKV